MCVCVGHVVMCVCVCRTCDVCVSVCMHEGVLYSTVRLCGYVSSVETAMCVGKVF